MNHVEKICKEKFHEQEFVRPVCRILDEVEVDYRVKEYFRLKRSDFDVEKVILCGTSLRDFEYLKNIRIFDWLKDYRGDILGICGGCQVLAHFFGGEVYKNKEIGKILVRLRKDFLSLPEQFFVYSLHNLGITFPRGFEVVAESEQGVQIVRREVPVDDGRTRQILGVLFHPEVLNKEIVEGFARR